ncbi:MAG: Amuc_1099 family pilus-like system protein [Chthoniobacterales bacterium]
MFRRFPQQHFVNAILFLLFGSMLFFTAKNIFSFYHSEKIYQATLQKLTKLQKAVEEKGFRLTHLTSKQNEALFEQLPQNSDHYQILLPPELLSADPSAFQDKLQHDVSALQEEATQHHVLLPGRFFLALSQYENLPPPSSDLKKISLQEIILHFIAQKICQQNGLQLYQFELQAASEPCPNKFFSSLGSLSIHFATDELSFQKFFHELIQSPYFLIVKTVSVENSQPNPPSRLLMQKYLKSRPTLDSNSNIKIILGRENIIVRLELELFDIRPLPSPHAEESCTWQRTKENTPLFVSHPYFIKNGELVDLLEEKTPLYPPIPNQWLVDNNLDYSNPNILSEDPDDDGFTNLEEWLGSSPLEAPGVYSSNPNDPTSRPPLWTKLKYSINDIQKSNYRFEFTGYETEGSQKIFQLQPKTLTPNITKQGKRVFNKKIRYGSLGEQLDGLPLQIFSFDKKERVHQGVSYDTSELTLLNIETGEKWRLVKKSILYPDSTPISILEGIQFHYTLTSPPQLFNVRLHDSFTLESLPLPMGTTSETYRLLDIRKNEVELEKEETHYVLPITG